MVRAATPVRDRRRPSASRLRAGRAGTGDASAVQAAEQARCSSATAVAISRANRPARVSISKSPPESLQSRSHRSSAASTRRASARSGVTSAVVTFSGWASRMATAIASASALHVRRLDDGDACMPLSMRREMSGVVSRSRHSAVESDGRMASDVSCFAVARAAGRQIGHRHRGRCRNVPSSAYMANCGCPAAGGVRSLRRHP